MYLLAAALVVGNALAFPELSMPIGGGCGQLPPPCTRLATGDASILPSDWFVAVGKNLNGEFNWFRVEVPLDAGRFDVQIAEFLLDEHWYSTRESSPSTAVYYVPASENARILVTSDEGEIREPVLFIDGSALAWF